VELPIVFLRNSAISLHLPEDVHLFCWLSPISVQDRVLYPSGSYASLVSDAFRYDFVGVLLWHMVIGFLLSIL